MGDRAVGSAGGSVVDACIRAAAVSRATATVGAAGWLRRTGAVGRGDLAIAGGALAHADAFARARVRRCSRAACIAASGIRFTAAFSSGPSAWRSRRRAACISCSSHCSGYSSTPKQRMKNGCSRKNSAATLSMPPARRVSFLHSSHSNEKHLPPPHPAMAHRGGDRGLRGLRGL
jgi:hypothetical protein